MLNIASKIYRNKIMDATITRLNYINSRYVSVQFLIFLSYIYSTAGRSRSRQGGHLHRNSRQEGENKNKKQTHGIQYNGKINIIAEETDPISEVHSVSVRGTNKNLDVSFLEK